uniref:hypothetical protein n=1 Tax=Streptomyces sp. FR1 TaxID=349971 RepID=UPI0015E84B11|nr:hypothetical protein [Streptomyces sp. FR1]
MRSARRLRQALAGRRAEDKEREQGGVAFLASMFVFAPLRPVLRADPPAIKHVF